MVNDGGSLPILVLHGVVRVGEFPGNDYLFHPESFVLLEVFGNLANGDSGASGEKGYGQIREDEQGEHFLHLVLVVKIRLRGLRGCADTKPVLR